MMALSWAYSMAEVLGVPKAHLTAQVMAMRKACLMVPSRVEMMALSWAYSMAEVLGVPKAHLTAQVMAMRKAWMMVQGNWAPRNTPTFSRSSCNTTCPDPHHPDCDNNCGRPVPCPV